MVTAATCGDSVVPGTDVSDTTEPPLSKTLAPDVPPGPLLGAARGLARPAALAVVTAVASVAPVAPVHRRAPFVRRCA